MSFFRNRVGFRFIKKSRPLQMFRFIVLTFMLLAILGCKISGKVTLDDEGLTGVSVILEGDGIEKSTTTNSNGYYEFKDVPKGLYRISVHAPEGYRGSPTHRVTKTSRYQNVYSIHFPIKSNTIKNLTNGTIVGSHEDNGVFAWLGIPFAEAPLGDLRWKAPVPEASWEDTYMAIKPCLPCVQFAGMFSNLPEEYDGDVIGSEDCLYLNVWAPSSMTGDLSPVMFWIHGGGNSTGEGVVYNGKKMAEKHNMVVVSINYRLGPFGWFAHPSLRGEGTSPEDQSGNFGTLDIIRGLQWVQENIEVFGGDKNNVTVFGESAGAINTLTLLASPLTEGLFHRAISQSPVIEWIAEHSNWQPMSVAENYSDDDEPGYPQSSREIVNTLLIADELAEDRDEAKTLQDSMENDEIETYLRDMSCEKIMSVYDTKHGGMIIMPTAIQDGLVIPEKGPLQVFQSGDYHKVPAIIGTNRDEYKLFMFEHPDYSLMLLDTIPLIKNVNDYNLASMYYSEAWKITGVDEIVSAMNIHQPGDVYAYRFDWDEEPNIFGFDVSVILGAAHGLEIPSAFGDPDMVIIDKVKSFVYSSENRKGRISLADSMASYWAAMAYNGSPGEGMPYETQSIAWAPWSDQPEVENIIVFDSPLDSGIDMVNLHLYSEDAQVRLQNEEAFSTEEVRCRIYRDIYGEDEHYQTTCSGD